MAAIPVTITGTMTYTGLEIGGGPMPGGPPLGIWGGGNVPFPTPPIYFPPSPGGEPSHPIVIPPAPPLGIWGGGNVPYPTPPIYIPPAPTEPPSGSDGRWGYVPGVGWVWVPAGSGDKPHPPQAPA
jgi:hypothetical protein